MKKTMIKIEIANIPIGLSHSYSFVERLSRDYLTEREPFFVIESDEAAIDEELKLAEEGTPREYAEGTVLFRGIAERLPEYSALVFHGAVIVYDNIAYIVTAKSGVGKTTHVSLWLREFGDKAHVLNGDKPVLRELDGRIYACATPWRGKEGYGVNEMLPLGGIAILSRSAENFASDMSKEEALMPFVSQCYIPKNAVNALLALKLTDKIINSVPFISLNVNMEQEAARVALNAFLKNSEN